MIIQFLVAMVATAAFSVLYSVPRKNILPGAVAGGVGWIIYFTLEKAGADTIVYAFTSAFFLGVISRICAVLFKTPVTLYLLPGIFPIVPGAGIYYTAYYFFMNDMASFAKNATEITKIALAISFGIIFALSIPHGVFSLLSKLKKD